MDAGRLLARAAACARSEGARARAEAARRATERDAAIERRSDDRATRRLVAAAVPIPFVRGALLRRYDRDIAERSEAIEALAREAAKLAGEAAGHSGLVRKADRTASRVAKGTASLAAFGTPPQPILPRIDRIARASTVLSEGRRGRRWIEDVIDLGEECVEVARDWVAMTEEARSRAARPRAATGPAPAGAATGARIYLPVPVDAAKRAIAQGAASDPDSPPWQSRAYVTRGMDLAPFRDMLPLALRPKAPAFEFPPIHFRAAGQNLWGLFDDDTWRHVKQSCTSQTGRRCAVCGKTGGWFAKEVFGEKGGRDNVDCHEVWNWTMPDQRSGIGVQTLRRILVLCPDCHMAFHSGYAIGRARDNGLDEQATEFIKRRRMAMNRVGEEELARGLDATKGRLKALLSGVDKWVIDLGALGAQQYMLDRTPVFREDNKAGVPAERIAGLAFETDAGRTFASRAAAEVHRSLIDGDGDLGYNVHPIHSRR